MPQLTLKQIQIFDTVVRYKSHTRAATELHMTQPAVSMQMKQMELLLDVQLFERHGKSISLTKDAEELRKYSADIIRSYRAMMDQVNVLKGSEQGTLIVSVTTTANYFATRILAAFSKMHPEIKISLDVTNRRKILTQLERNEPDQVIMGEPPDNLDLGSEVFLDNPLVIIAPPDHVLCKEKNIALHRLLQEKFVLREKGSGTRAAIERHMEGFKDCTSSLEMSSNEAIKHAVAAGFGLGVVSKHTISMELQNNYLKILNVEGFPINRHWHLVTRKGKVVSPVAQSFRQFLLKEAQNFVE
ncbi:MAG: RuBisCO operon transcriptional regulator CbbR [uncultured Thiotrichaceae bacterium]|uniref:RuBisCO operon transcriptional regulator CbbR n=1 Tax=uncultured Thiotrichaceae bacterium TaxID=298394 RepID=A0A6S6UH98_9GAMM|nr:MAG: RuBisCO operon transcriptional regulator CbbR [uncultured Thiotrichaceae bacterium]